MSTRPKKKTPVVAVINMKGGVGKTTLCANVSREIFRRKNLRTLIIDFDPQFNLSQLLLTKGDYIKIKSSGKTLLSIIEAPMPDSAFTVSAQTGRNSQKIAVNDYAIQLKYLTSSPEVELRLLAGDFGLAWLNLRENEKSLHPARSKFTDLIQEASSLYDLVVIDCNPSSSFLTRCAMETASHLLIPVRPDRFSILGVEMILDYVEQMPTIEHIPYSIVLNGVRTDTVTEIETQIRAHPVLGPNVLVPRIPHSNLLAAKTDHSGFAVDKKVPHRRSLESRLAQVADAFSERLGF